MPYTTRFPRGAGFSFASPTQRLHRRHNGPHEPYIQPRKFVGEGDGWASRPLARAVTADTIDYLTAEDLIILADSILGQRPIVRDPGLLSAAAARPSTVVFGQVAYPTLFGKAAALLSSTCQNHTLLDGNKRLARASAVTFLALNDIPVPDIDVDAAEVFMLAVANGKLTGVAEIESSLRDLYGR